MSVQTAPKFGVKFPTRKERTVKRVTKCETREIQKRLEPPKPPKPARVRPPPKPKAPKKAAPPATLIKPPRAAPRGPGSRSNVHTSISSKQTISSAPRTLQLTDLEKLGRLNCSREFSLFHQYIKSQLSKSYENQLGFLQTKLQHLKNEFVDKQTEHLNFEQIKDYYNQAVKEHVRRLIKPDEYLTLADKIRQDTKLAIDKWVKKKEFKPQKHLNEYLQRRQERIRDQIKETMVEQKKQQLAKEAENESASGTTKTSTIITKIPAKATEDDDDIMIID